MDFLHGRNIVQASAGAAGPQKKEDISPLAGVALSSVRYDDAMPLLMRDRLEQVAINKVATLFAGDANTTAPWFKARNPMRGDISPRDMIWLGC